ncbi:MAG TPA: hypothetical protein VKT73_12960 [Xanthobacteraceae bacterium]|nr:hypothetical protein [Xanthobacteraceae bacterium]
MRKLDLRTGDFVVIETKRALSWHERERAQDLFRQVALSMGVRVTLLIMDQDDKLKVLRPERHPEFEDHVRRVAVPAALDAVKKVENLSVRK